MLLLLRDWYRKYDLAEAVGTVLWRNEALGIELERNWIYHQLTMLPLGKSAYRIHGREGRQVLGRLGRLTRRIGNDLLLVTMTGVMVGLEGSR